MIAAVIAVPAGGGRTHPRGPVGPAGAGCGSSSCSCWSGSCSAPASRHGGRTGPPARPRHRHRGRRLRHRPGRRHRAAAEPGRRGELEPGGLQPPVSLMAGTVGGLLGSAIGGADRAAAPSARRRTGERPVSILVIDVGTSGLRAAIVRPDADRRRTSHHQRLPPSTPFPGLVEFDAAEHGRRGARASPAQALADGRPGRRGRHHQPAGLDRRVGSRHRRARRPRPRLAGPAHGVRLPHPGRRARHPAGPEPVGHQAGLAAPGRARPGPRARPVLRHGRHVAGVDAVGGSRSTSPIRSNAAVTGSARTDLDLRLVGPRARDPAHPPLAACPTSSTPAEPSARRPRSPARRRSPRSSATSRARSSGRAACARAWPRSPSARAGCSTPAPVPRRRRAGSATRTARSRSWPGRSGAS